MATVPDLSGNSPVNAGTDNKFEKPNRVSAGSPQGSLTPEYANEIVHDTTNNDFYRAYGTTQDEWERFVRNT